LEAAEVLDTDECLASKTPTLVGWNAQVFEGLLVDIATHRNATSMKKNAPVSSSRGGSAYVFAENGGTVRDEVTEMVTMPEFDPKSFQQSEDGSTSLSTEVQSQLRDYITLIAEMYHRRSNYNAFHNFEHASHVLMLVVKTPSTNFHERCPDGKIILTKKSYFNFIYGISSDPPDKVCYCI
jgi:hypothetical protein